MNRWNVTHQSMFADEVAGINATFPFAVVLDRDMFSGSILVNWKELQVCSTYDGFEEGLDMGVPLAIFTVPLLWFLWSCLPSWKQWWVDPGISHIEVCSSGQLDVGTPSMRFESQVPRPMYGDVIDSRANGPSVAALGKWSGSMKSGTGGLLPMVWGEG